MIILAIDTNLKMTSVAVVKDGRLLSHYCAECAKDHSVVLFSAIREVMDKADIEISEIDIFATTAGPGSFTGIRIGVSSASALAYATGKPVVGINTLDCLAYGSSQYSNQYSERGFLVCPLINARNNQVFAAIYENGKIIGDYMVCDISEFSYKLVSLCIEEKTIEGQISDTKVVLLTGDAAALHLDYLKESNEGSIEIFLAKEDYLFPSAHILAEMAANQTYNGNYAGNKINLDNIIRPFYMRKSQAERMREMELQASD